MIELRDYQVKGRSEIRQAYAEGHRSVLYQLPTGGGKTKLVASILGDAAAKGKRSMFTVHRVELLKQSIKAFNEAGIGFGIIAAGVPESPKKLVQIASVQTLVRRLARHAEPDLIAEDEAHHVAAGMWTKVRGFWQRSRHLGVSATPERLDGKGLSAYYSKMIQGPPVAWLIEQGHLSRYKLLSPRGFSVEGVHTVRGEFDQKELSAAADRAKVTGDAIVHYKRHCAGRRAVVFEISVERSKQTAALFSKNGIPAEHVDGETKKDERDAAIRRFEAGTTLVLVNVGLFSEGFDVPAIEAVIDLAPSQSIVNVRQRWGRALRPAAGKDIAIILDHAGNAERHMDLPDMDREWSLDGRKKGKAGLSGQYLRTCPRCFASHKPGTMFCNAIFDGSVCGYVWKAESREVEQVEGDLVEIDAAQIARARRMEEGSAQTLADLIALGRKRGYKDGWAQARYSARIRKQGALT